MNLDDTKPNEPIMIEYPDSGTTETEGKVLVAQAGAVLVRSKDEHGAALEFLLGVGRCMKRVKDLFAPAKKAAHDAHKAIVAAENRLLEPLEIARSSVTRTIGAYEQAERERAWAAEVAARKAEEDRRAAEAERARREAMVAAKQAPAAQAAEILDAGDRAAEAIASAPIIVPAAAPPQVARVAGVSSAKTWSAEVYDKPALIQYVASHPEWFHLLDPAMPALNGLAKSQRESLAIPGVRSVSKTGFRTGA